MSQSSKSHNGTSNKNHLMNKQLQENMNQLLEDL